MTIMMMTSSRYQVTAHQQTVMRIHLQWTLTPTLSQVMYKEYPGMVESSDHQQGT